MTPQEAGFDGAKGVALNHPALPNGGIYRLRRNINPPWKYGKNCRNQLIWQESDPPHLFYCNSDGEWFELSFTPIKTK